MEKVLGYGLNSERSDNRRHYCSGEFSYVITLTIGIY